MKCVNEPLARLANREDGCKGRFREGRFRSQALLDDEAVLKCMAYVDLNPVRANVAVTPEASDHTSIQARMEARAEALAPMADHPGDGYVLPIGLRDYLDLVDYTGRALRHDKRARSDAALPPILQRLPRSGRRSRLDDMANLSRRYCRAIGSAVSLQDYRDFLGQKRLNGVTG